MKLLTTILVCLIGYQTIAQGTSCQTMGPICTDVGLNFTANSGVTPASTTNPGNNYDCLGSTPNPTWYYLEIGTSGSINMNLTAASDIDFIIYGPYASQAAAAADCNGMGVGPNNVVDCSYSSTNNETPSIPNAIAGQVYVMLITNYANVVQNTVLIQSSGTGSTDCSIVTPCSLNNFTANISACNPANNTYSVSGTIQYTNPPSSGQLIVQDCDGNQVVVANAPFAANGSQQGSYNYNLTGLPADGGPCNVHVFFSAEPDCDQTINYTAPACPCYFSFLSTNIGACDPADNTFDITGQLQFVSQPSTGTLTVSDCNGNSQTFNAPFTSPINYSLNNIQSTGQTNCTVTASFSANPACNITSNPFTYPTACVCDADAGTFSDGTIGSTNATGPYELCFGDMLDIDALGDYTPPQFFSGIAATYNPGMWLLIYDCPPTVTPSADINTDPCLLGIASTNDQAWTILNNAGGGDTYYYVPVTMYSMVDGVYAVSINGGNWCYDVGPTYPVTFLDEITANVTTNCQAGTATATITGGMPAVNGSNFSIVPGSLSPANASFNNTSTTNGGTIVISGLVNGDNFSYQVVDSKNCPVTITGSFTGVNAATFSYPQTAYCINAANASPTITGVTGGTFSSTAGLSINPVSGVINFGASTAGNYVVTYTSPGAPCNDSETFNITVNPLPVINVPNVAFCAGGSVPVNASGANTYSWSPATGLSATTGATVTANPAATSNYVVTGTNTTTGCVGTGNVTVTVNPLPAIGGTLNACVGATSQLNGTATAAAVTPWQSSNTGVATISNAGLVTAVSAGTTTITYTNTNGCNTTAVFTVNALPTVSVADVSLCPTSTINITASGASTYTWAPGTNLSATTGTTVTFTPGTTTNYTVTGTAANGCQNSDAFTVTVFASPVITASADDAICMGESTTISVIGGVSYTWNNGLGVGNSHLVSPNATTTYSVTGTDANGCFNSDNVTITVNPLPIINAGPDQAICIGEQVTLTASGAGVGGNYAWTNPIVNGVAFTPNATAMYTVTGTDVNGCQNTDDVIVVVNLLPIINAGNDLTGCEDDQFILTGSGAGVTGTYQWDNGVTNGVPFDGQIGTTTYTVIGTDVNGCVNTDDLTIFIEATPTVSFAFDQDQNCAPVIATFQNTSNPAGVNQIWYLDDGTVFNGAGPFTHEFTVPGTYGASLQIETAVNGCVGTLYLSDIIVVDPNPVAAFTADPSITTVLNTEINFENNSSGASNYEWDFGDGTGMSTATNPTHEYEPEPESYTVTLVAISSAGCTDTAIALIRINDELIYYIPNTFTPDLDQFNETFQPVFTSGFDPYDYTLYIFNRWGEIIFESHDTEVGWGGRYGVDGNECQEGTYSWKIEFKTTETDERKSVVGHVNLLR